jgi:hypothetical protein
MLESCSREVLDGNFGHGIGYPEVSIVLLGVPLKRQVSRVRLLKSYPLRKKVRNSENLVIK